MGRKILFITTDQQRFDALGCNGGSIARTPVVDSLAAEGINFTRAHNQNTVCMPARSTMITGQYVRTHGVYANGVPLPIDAPSVAHYLNDVGGYKTALIGKAHFQPHVDFNGLWEENKLAREGRTGPYRGFDHVELATHGYHGFWHYCLWLKENFPDETNSFFPVIGQGGLNAEGGGDTGAPEAKYNPMPKEHYHTDWVADRTIAYLDSLDPDANWFIWMSFPDPHHPWDPPESEARKFNWRDIDLLPGHPESDEEIVKILGQKPKHWLDWYEGRFMNPEGSPIHFRPNEMTHDQFREVNALIHAENQLIDQACGRVMKHVEDRGWAQETDVFFTTDHGELQGDFGLLFKGPYHTEALMHVPLIWRPAPSAGIDPASVPEPVGHVDLAPTFCEIAGLEVPDFMQGRPLPVAGGSDRETVLTEWDSQMDFIDMHLRTISTSKWICTVYEAGGMYEGTEGELYDMENDPHQWRNLWDDPDYQSIRTDLIATLYDQLPVERDPKLKVEAMV